MKTILSALIAIQVCLVSSKECTEEVVNKCLEPIKGFETEINSAVVIFLEEDELREHCRLYREYSDCMADVRPNCARVDRLVFEGIDDSYHYLCEEKFDEYLYHRECLKNEELHNEGDACNATLSAKLDKLDSNRSLSWRRDRICQYAEDYLDCVQNAVKSFCSSAAGLWQRELDERSLWPLLQEIDCPGFDGRPWWRDSDGNADMFIIIVTVVLIFICVVIVILGALMYRMYRKKKALREARAARRTANSRSADGGPYVSYGNGAVAVHGADHGPAGPLPNKGMLPPPYTMGASGANPGGDGIPPPMMAEGPAPSMVASLPPAYSDIADDKSKLEGFDNFAAVGVSPNPMYDNRSRDQALYDNASSTASQAGSRRN